MTESPQLAGVRFVNLRGPELAEHILNAALGGEQMIVIPVNPAVFLAGWNDPDVGRSLIDANCATIDGVGIQIALWFRGNPWPHRTPGTDLMLQVVKGSVRHGLRVFLAGGVQGVAARCAEALKGMFPGVRITGAFEPPLVGSAQGLPESEMVRLMNESRAEVVFVALGVPKQELFIAKNRHRLQARIIMAVGASFDFISGDRRRAPRWLRRFGLEWLFRLVREPVRLSQRYIIGIPKFFWTVLRYRHD